jgi:uncharacterized peroxidase-related enzyme
MTWIHVIDPAEAAGRLAGLYEQVAGTSGRVDNILQAHSLRPRTLEGHLALYKAAMHSPNAMSPRERELMGVVVSMTNACDYCVSHHLAGLARHVGDEALAARLADAAMTDGASDELTERERAMARYAIKLTRSPGAVDSGDCAALRAAGLADDAILDINQVVAYFAYANRTVLGLGVGVDGEALGLHPPEGGDGLAHG